MVKIATLISVAVAAATIPSIVSASSDFERRASDKKHSKSSSSSKSSHKNSSKSNKSSSSKGTAAAVAGGAAAGGAVLAAAASSSSFTGSLPASVESIVATISSGTPTNTPTGTAKTTYTAGAVNPSITNAPGLPDANSLVISDFPTLDELPSASLAFSKKILASIDLSDVPAAPKTDGTCSGSPDALKSATSSGFCWWTCGGCTRDTDVTTCPDKNHWGLSYDDGPSPYTPQLLDYLEENNLKSTFFVVGSRALSRPDLLRYEYMTGHQLSVHTWSHPALTSLTNEQIALELGWTKEVIRQITGVTPVTMRPPYGDIDDRVRAICKKLNLTPIIWTSTSSESNYDTNDWQIGAGKVSAAEVTYNFEQILKNASQLDTGYIVLAHDLYQQSVELATEVVLPAALAQSPKQTVQPIITCQGRELGDSYVETNRNVSGSGGVGSPGGLDSAASVASSSATSSSSSSSSSGGISDAVPVLSTLSAAVGGVVIGAFALYM